MTHSTLQGRMVPLSAGIYGVRVYPGPNLGEGGMWHQAEPNFTGVVVLPSRSTMCEWMRHGMEDARGGRPAVSPGSLAPLVR